MDVARFTYMENPAKSSLIVRSYALQMKVSFPSWELPNNCETQFPVARTGWVVLDGNFVNLGFKMHKGKFIKAAPIGNNIYWNHVGLPVLVHLIKKKEKSEKV